MILRRGFLFGLLAAGLSACASKLRAYNGPEVTRVVLQKEQRRLYLMNEDKILKAYDVALGFAPVGPKQFEGDGRTPEGIYYINRRNPNSEFHLSIGISYPSKQDVAFASAQGRQAGGDIFIHGTNGKNRNGRRDWTAGCIAVKDTEIEEIYAMVRDGTIIHLNA